MSRIGISSPPVGLLLDDCYLVGLLMVVEQMVTDLLLTLMHFPRTL